MGRLKGKAEREAGWLGLSAAILRQAANDYIKALNTRSGAATARRLEKFFLSDWGQMLSRDQGEEIIKTCRELAKEYVDLSHLK